MAAPTSPLTLGDLLDQEDLGLRLVVETPDARERPIAGAHAIDVPRPAAWIDRHWLVLMTGGVLRDDADAAATIVEELARSEVAALAFGLAPFFSQVPEELLAAARAHALPVVAVPVTTPFREIVERVFRSTLSTDVRVSQRLVAMQRYLMDALGDELPQLTAIERLATLIKGDVALLTREGHLEHATTPMPHRAVWEHISSRPVTTLEFELDGRQWLATPVADRRGVVSRWLVTVVPAGASPQVMKAAAHAAVPLLTAVRRLEVAGRTQQRAARSVVLNRLLDGETADPVVPAQLRQLGFRLNLEMTMVDALPEEDTETAADRLLDAIEEEFDQLGIPFLAGMRGRRVAVLGAVPPSEMAAVFTRLAEPLSIRSAGIGTAASALGDITRSFRSAQLAAEYAPADADDEETSVGRVRCFDELGTATVILAEVDLGRIAEHAERLSEELRDQPASIETLRTFFDHRMSITTTAEKMHLHPNSLRYRLGRIEKSVGGSLRDPATIAAIYLALRALPIALPDQPASTPKPASTTR
jgi:DNA-binding PucR family transcriptional regulator